MLHSLIARRNRRRWFDLGLAQAGGMDPLAGNVLVLSDLEHGNGKWRNISSIIRFTLRVLLRTVDQQNARIQALEAASRTKASNADVRAAVATVSGWRGGGCREGG